jgi:cyanophycinase
VLYRFFDRKQDQGAAKEHRAPVMKYATGMSRSQLLQSCVLLAGVAFFSLPSASYSQVRPTQAYSYHRLGNPAEVTATPRPGFALMGGGSDLDEAFRWLCGRAGGGDILVLRAAGGDDYNPYIQGLCHVNSVATLIVPSRAAAMDPFVAQTIRRASALFIAGGDQANYMNFWSKTPMQAAQNEAIGRGVPIGGTSAGLAVLGEYIYSAQADKLDDPDLDSKTALANPYHPRITLSSRFLDIPVLKGVITDTHFARRDRMGRLLTFLARLTEPDGKPGPGLGIRGIGVEEGAAVLVEPDGQAVDVGCCAYFLEPKRTAEQLEPGKPLTFRTVSVQKVLAGHAFNLKTWQGDGQRYSLSVEAGGVRSTQTGSAIY